MDPWMMASFGMQLLSGASASASRRAQIEAQSIIDRANADAANVTRKANNEVSAATTSLQNYARSLNNKRAGAAAGARIDAIKINAGRAMDKLTQTGVAHDVQSVEQFGQVVAAAAAAGVSGGSIDAVRRAMALRRGIQQEQLSRATKQTQFDFESQQSAAISDLVGSVDIATSMASMDYGVSQPPVRFMSSRGQDLLNILPKLDWRDLRDGLYSQPKGLQAGSMSGNGSVQGNTDYFYDL
jgi:hypothetical protein